MVNQPTSHNSKNTNYESVFLEYFSYYLAIGMSYALYWHGDCELVKSYRKADEIRQNRRNQELWLQGMYIYEALLDASPIMHAFAKKGTKPIPYSKEPYPITKKQIEEKEQREEQERYNRIKAKLQALSEKGGNLNNEPNNR